MNAVDLGELRLRAVCVNAPRSPKGWAGHVVWGRINSISNKDYYSFALEETSSSETRSLCGPRERKERDEMLAQYATSTRTDYFVCVKCASNIVPLGESISLMLSANFIPILSRFMRFTYEGSRSLAVGATCSWRRALCNSRLHFSKML